MAPGDTSTCGPNPRECLALVDQVADVLLAGNHEGEAALPARGELEVHGAARAQHRLDGLHFVHASASKPFEQDVWPGHPHHHLHLNQRLDNSLVALLDACDATHSIVGHTHAPSVLTAYQHRALPPIAQDWNRRLTVLGPRSVFSVPAGALTLEGLSGKRLVVNPGSVGQPRDHDPRRSFADRLALGE